MPRDRPVRVVLSAGPSSPAPGSGVVSSSGDVADPAGLGRDCRTFTQTINDRQRPDNSVERNCLPNIRRSVGIRTLSQIREVQLSRTLVTWLIGTAIICHD